MRRKDILSFFFFFATFVLLYFIRINFHLCSFSTNIVYTSMFYVCFEKKIFISVSYYYSKCVSNCLRRLKDFLNKS